MNTWSPDQELQSNINLNHSKAEKNIKNADNYRITKGDSP
jgi:hypothetical protein